MRETGSIGSTHMALAYYEALYFANTFMSQKACSFGMPEFLVHTMSYTTSNHFTYA